MIVRAALLLGFAILLDLIGFCTLPARVNFSSNSAFYIEMVQRGNTSVEPPFRYRALVPFVARLLPLPADQVLAVMSHVSLGGCLFLAMLICRRIGLSIPACAFGATALFCSRAFTYNYVNPYMTDAVALLAMLAMVYSYIGQQDTAFSIAALVGVLAHEITVFLVPAELFSRRWKRGAAICATSAIVFLLTRFWLGTGYAGSLKQGVLFCLGSPRLSTRLAEGRRAYLVPALAIVRDGNRDAAEEEIPAPRVRRAIDGRGRIPVLVRIGHGANILHTGTRSGGRHSNCFRKFVERAPLKSARSTDGGARGDCLSTSVSNRNQGSPLIGRLLCSSNHLSRVHVSRLLRPNARRLRMHTAAIRQFVIKLENRVAESAAESLFPRNPHQVQADSSHLHKDICRGNRDVPRHAARWSDRSDQEARDEPSSLTSPPRPQFSCLPNYARWPSSSGVRPRIDSCPQIA